MPRKSFRDLIDAATQIFTGLPRFVAHRVRASVAAIPMDGELVLQSGGG